MALVTLMVGAAGPTSRAYALGTYVAECLDEFGHTTLIIDPGHIPADALISGDSSAPAIRGVVEAVAAADAVVPVTPVRNGSYSAALKALLDLLPPGALTGKTVMPVATGGTSSHLTGLEYSLHPVIADLGGRHVLRGAYILDRDLDVHGCGASVAPESDDDLRLALAALSAALGAPAYLGSADTLLIDPDEAVAAHRAGALLLDVRRSGDRDRPITGVVHVEKADVPDLFDPQSVQALGIQPVRPIIVFCNSERGSLRVVATLRELGYADVRHVRGAAAELARVQESWAHAHLG